MNDFIHVALKAQHGGHFRYALDIENAQVESIAG